MGEIKGYISQVIGPVVDIHFDNGKEEKITLPRIHDAMEITRPNGKILIVEVQQHIGENTVRTISFFLNPIQIFSCNITNYEFPKTGNITF